MVQLKASVSKWHANDATHFTAWSAVSTISWLSPSLSPYDVSHTRGKLSTVQAYVSLSAQTYDDDWFYSGTAFPPPCVRRFTPSLFTKLAYNSQWQQQQLEHRSMRYTTPHLCVSRTADGSTDPKQPPNDSQGETNNGLNSCDVKRFGSNSGCLRLAPKDM